MKFKEIKQKNNFGEKSSLNKLYLNFIKIKEEISEGNMQSDIVIIDNGTG